MYDYLIIGAGIVGLSVAERLIRKHPDRRILLVDKAAHAAAHQSGHNSGVIHSGIYYPPDSLKARLCIQGNHTTKAFCATHDIRYESCGKMVVATDEDEKHRLDALFLRAQKNGIPCQLLTGKELNTAEAQIKGVAAIHVRSTAIVSYREICTKMRALFEAAGGEVWMNAQVSAIAERANDISIETARGDASGRFLVACAGLQADRVVAMTGVTPGFTICPFRGEYYRLAEKHAGIVRHLIYPVPAPGVPFLGVHLTRMIDGSVTVGPNAVLAFAREGYRRTQVDLKELIRMVGNRGVRTVLRKNLRHGLKEQRNSLFPHFYLKEVRKYCPQIQEADLKPYPAGVRAQAVSDDGKLIDDFLFKYTSRSLHVCNAPSPAATSAIPIADYIVAQMDYMGR